MSFFLTFFLSSLLSFFLCFLGEFLPLFLNKYLHKNSFKCINGCVFYRSLLLQKNLVETECPGTLIVGAQFAVSFSCFLGTQWLFTTLLQFPSQFMIESEWTNVPTFKLSSSKKISSKMLIHSKGGK